MRIILSLVCFLFSMKAFADIRLPAVVSANMVLQQNSNVKIWGWADPNEKVTITVSWNGKKDSTVADGNAKWMFSLPTPAAGGPYTITLKGNNLITLENILIGEVWICSGQSNMEMNYNWGLPQMRDDIPKALNPNIRFFHVPKSTALQPQEKGEGNWISADTNSVKSFSAVAYYFGKKLQEQLDVPVGLIHASWGGTPAEAWTPSYIIEQDPVLKDAAQQLDPSKYWPVSPAHAYNSMIAPLVNFNIAGAIWYQGESNVGTASTYHRLFSSMIKSWRDSWKNEFPFLFVQLAPYAYGNKNVGALLREAQEKTLEVPGTAMVVTMDIGGDTTDIHPRNKRDVGHRLASLALTHVYEMNFDFVKSPSYNDMIIEGSVAIISFDAPGSLTVKGKRIIGFQIAGEDGRFFDAEAELVGNKIYVSHDKVSKPVAVRYAFSNTAIGNVFGENGLPVAPFRTDNWKVDTSPIK